MNLYINIIFKHLQNAFIIFSINWFIYTKPLLFLALFDVFTEPLLFLALLSIYFSTNSVLN